MRKSIPINILLFLFCILQVQAQIQIKGQVLDESNKPMDFVNIVCQKDGILLSNAISDNNGIFQLEIKEMQSVDLSFSFVGYRTKVLKVEKDKLQPFLTIVMETEAIALDEVAVMGKRSYIKADAKAITINIPKNSSMKNESMLELIKKLPGVTDSGGGLSVAGVSGVIVVIDGKQVNMPDNLMLKYLESLPADNVQTVCVMKNPPAKYDAKGMSGCIEIINNKTYQQNSSPFISATIQGGITKKNFLHKESFGLRWQPTARFQLHADISHNKINRHFIQDMENGLFLNNEILDYNRNTLRDLKRHLYNYSVGLNYSLSPTWELELCGEGYYDDWKAYGSSEAVAVNKKGEEIGAITSQITSVEPYGFHSIYGRIVKSFVNRGKINIDMNFMTYNNRSDGSVEAQGTLIQPVQTMLSQPLNIHTFMGKIDYSGAIGAKATWEIGAKYDEAHLFTDIHKMINPLKTEEKYGNRHIEKNAALYSSIQIQGDKDLLSCGIRVEYSGTERKTENYITQWEDQKKSYIWNIYPQLSYSHDFSQNFKMGVSASRRTNRPTYINLSPVSWPTDALFRLAGNPNLSSEYIWKGDLNLFLFKKYNFSATYSYIKNGIYYILKQEKNIVSTFPDNYPEFRNIYFNLNLPFSIKNIWDANINIGGGYSVLPYSSDEESFTLKKWSGSVNLNQTFHLPWGIDAEAITQYRSKIITGYLQAPPFFMTSLSFSKDFLRDKSLNATLSLKDVFNTMSIGSEAIGTAFPFKMRMTTDSFCVMLTIKYLLGKNWKSKNSIHIDDSRFDK